MPRLQIFYRRPILFRDDLIGRASSVDAQRTSEHESGYPELAPYDEQVETPHNIHLCPAQRISLRCSRQDRRQVNDSADALGLKHAAPFTLLAYVADYPNARILTGPDLWCNLIQQHKSLVRTFEQAGDRSANESGRAGNQGCAL